MTGFSLFVLMKLCVQYLTHHDIPGEGLNEVKEVVEEQAVLDVLVATETVSVSHPALSVLTFQPGSHLTDLCIRSDLERFLMGQGHFRSAVRSREAPYGYTGAVRRKIDEVDEREELSQVVCKYSPPYTCTRIKTVEIF
ncbi:hypothetical protein Btru_000757 [Bulinus truncatus]|nr:hypothetical protein Btru_000757 [Bulinus truncatus]